MDPNTNKNRDNIFCSNSSGVNGRLPSLGIWEIGGANDWNCKPNRDGKNPKPAENDIPPNCAFNWPLMLCIPAALVCCWGSGRCPPGRLGTLSSTRPPLPPPADGVFDRGSCPSAPRMNNGMTFSRLIPALQTGQHGVFCVFNQRYKHGQQYKWPHCVTTGSFVVISKHILHINALSLSADWYDGTAVVAPSLVNGIDSCFCSAIVDDELCWDVDHKMRKMCRKMGKYFIHFLLHLLAACGGTAVECGRTVSFRSFCCESIHHSFDFFDFFGSTSCRSLDCPKTSNS